ncbi:hypothetical protein SAMN05216601_104325 [Ectopseudomonas composti]|uniref:Uncharacterized protein n=1 Tax=Ectopseudomonas composti TaxID=658457 RepID=A0A1I5LXN4_9GAMM|nr:hypothetical protein SAMN05216601_104325 [Pseudomonas composti]
MSMIKRLFQQSHPAQQADIPNVQEHPNFWMYQ